MEKFNVFFISDDTFLKIIQYINSFFMSFILFAQTELT